VAGTTAQPWCSPAPLAACRSAPNTGACPEAQSAARQRAQAYRRSVGRPRSNFAGENSPCPGCRFLHDCRIIVRENRVTSPYCWVDSPGYAIWKAAYPEQASHRLQMNLELQPISYKEACEFIKTHTAIHLPPQGWKFGIAANDGKQWSGR